MPGSVKIINMLTYTISHFNPVHIQSFDNSAQNAIIHVAEQSDKNIGSSVSYSINRIPGKHPTEKKHYQYSFHEYFWQMSR